ncbi:MAG: PTS mannose/fructose/sorbose transporter subunit IIC [Bifidobacteriaceae bacterium]|jgi:PTS system mannose-specific IIC component|nr:PTS mannose/fructose/sorbose transporter subunit IIC [Bifidobacteriaceae bacterium]
MTILTIVLVIIFAFLAGMESILDQFQFHQPVVACTLIGLAFGDPIKGVILGGTLQLIALGWMNIGASIAPDAAFASVASAILVCGPAGLDNGRGIALAVPFSMAGLILTIAVRTVAIFIVHAADKAVEKGNVRLVEALHFGTCILQGLRVAIPAALILFLPPEQVTAALNSVPDVITNGLQIGGGFIVVIGYAMITNMMATKDLWPFFFVGFVVSQLDFNLIEMGAIGLCVAFIYINVWPAFQNRIAGSGGSGGGDDLDAVLEDY